MDRNLHCTAIFVCIIASIVAGLIIRRKKKTRKLSAPQYACISPLAHAASPEDIHLGQVLGSGEFAKVYAATWKGNTV